MVMLAEPKRSDRFLNLCCGSGTLLVERLQSTTTSIALGVDLSPEALTCARTNLEASGDARKALLVEADATRLPLEDKSFDTIVTDLPFGQLVGHQSNIGALYRGAVAEATRVVVPGGHFVAITTRVRLFDEALEPYQQGWRLQQRLNLKVPFQSGYIRPAV